MTLVIYGLAWHQSVGPCKTKKCEKRASSSKSKGVAHLKAVRSREHVRTLTIYLAPIGIAVLQMPLKVHAKLRLIYLER